MKSGLKATGFCIECKKKIPVPSWCYCYDCDIIRLKQSRKFASDRWFRKSRISMMKPEKFGVIGENADGLRLIG